MAALNFARGCEFSVDRDGIAHNYPESRNEGFLIHLDGITIHFEDEVDAVKMAKAILKRMGE